MRYAADLHLHSRYASGVSTQMTVEAIALWARRKGVDVIGTGDCLQPEWLQELESKLVPADEPGWFELRPEIEEQVVRELPASLRKPLRWVLSTELSCATPKKGRLNGIHHLVYFPSFDRLRKFRREVESSGDLKEGRPSLALDSKQLLEGVLSTGEDCHLAPAHIMNPYFSSLGVIEDGFNLEQWFGDLAPRLLAVETGLTSTPDMCRRFSFLDSYLLFSNSDAHSLENIGRECTLLETEPGYGPLFEALAGKSGSILGTVKSPITLTRYYLNRCGACAKSFEGERCPLCKGKLVQGSRDRLELIADRKAPVFPGDPPPYRMLLPLKQLIADSLGLKGGKKVDRAYEYLLSALGNERHILTEVPEDLLREEASPEAAAAILAQRAYGYSEKTRALPAPVAPPAQLEFL